MKGKLTGLLCACILFSGCQIGSAPTVQTQPPVQETAQPTVPPTTVPYTLLEHGTVVGESPNLLYISSEAVEKMVNPDLRPLGDDLLLSEYRDQKLMLNHIRLADGELLASTAVVAGEGTKVTAGSGGIGLCDRESGQVSILDEDLQPQRIYSVTAGGEDWYLTPDFTTLYIFYYDRGLVAVNLETGAEEWLLDNGFGVSARDGDDTHVIVEYTDRTDQKTYWRCLDLSTGALEKLPMGGANDWVAHQGEFWLLRDGEDHVLIQGQERRSFAWADSPVRLLSHQHLMAMDASNRELTVFDLDGTFRSRCVLPMTGSNGAVGKDFVWSDHWGGYFFTDFTGEGFRLMFWDVSADMEGEDLLAAMAEQPPEPMLEPELYQRAQEISDRHGVEVFIGEQCELVYTHYETYALTDPGYISAMLDLLDNTLSRYPDGFFRQLCYGTVETIRFEVVGALYAREGIEDYHNSVNAFAQNRDSYYGIVLNGFSAEESTIYHEISHIIDKKLEWDSLIRPDAMFSEEWWMDFQPEGFRFAESYVDMPEDVLAYLDSGYFIKEYSMTFPTEDRAVLMAAAMEQAHEYFGSGSGTRAKMQFYADCIRDCFYTEDWPETAPWEEVLK